jgi:hypothetical protein
VWLTPTQAQTSIQVEVRCAGSLLEGLPPNFDGTIYRVLTPYPYQGNGRWELEAITAQGSVLTSIPVPTELYLTISPVEISPDGRYIVFQPVAEGTALAVWDRILNVMTSLPIPAETADYLNAMSDPNWRQQRKIDWLAPDQFVIRYFDLENSFFLHQLAEQVFTVTQNPLTIVAGQRQSIDYPTLPFRRDDYINTSSYSPQHTYVQAMYEDDLVPWLDFRFQIYDTQTLELTADFNSDEAFRLVSEPRWSYDESVLFLRYYANDTLSQITEINVASGFQESRVFLDTLRQTFGSDFRVSGLRADVSPNSSRLLFTATSSDGIPYTIVYDYEAHTLNAVCRATTATSSPITGSSSYPVWVPDENLIGFYDVGNLFLFDTVSGQSYWKNVFPFVGWLDTPVQISTPTPNPTNTPTATFTPTLTSTPTFTPTSTFTPTLTFTPTPLVVCNVTIASNDALGFVNAINAANANGSLADTICLANSTYTFLTASNSIALPSITTPITIVGNGAVLERGSGAPQFRAFNVTTSGSLTLQNLTLRNFHAGGGNGGAVQNTGSLTLDGVTVTGNSARFAGGIHSNGTLTIANSTFTSNTSQENAGAIYLNSGTLTMSNTTLESNSARYGSGVYLNSGTAALTNVTVRSNTANEQGAGVYQRAGTLTITGGLFENNTARFGNGVYVDAGTATVTGATFQNSTATEEGAAIYNRTGTLSVADSAFTSNRARYGGAIANRGLMTVSGSNFTGNSAVESGGAIYHQNTNTQNGIAQSCFTGNTARFGGAVFGQTGNFNARDNWWGAASGPTSAMVNNQVVTNPFLTVGCPN